MDDGPCQRLCVTVLDRFLTSARPPGRIARYRCCCGKHRRPAGISSTHSRLPANSHSTCRPAAGPPRCPKKLNFLLTAMYVGLWCLCSRRSRYFCPSTSVCLCSTQSVGESGVGCRGNVRDHVRFTGGPSCMDSSVSVWLSWRLSGLVTVSRWVTIACL